MAIALDAVTQQQVTATGSFNHTCTGANLLLCVAVHLRTAVTLDSVSVTYNGVAMTSGVAVDFATVGSKKTWIFYLVNPATGSNSVAYTFTGAAESYVAAASFTGVDQADPTGATGSATTSSATSLTANLTTESANSWIVDALNEGGETLTPDGAQTGRWSGDTTPNGMTARGSTKTTTTAGANSTSWSFGGSAGAVLINLEIKEAAAASGPANLKTWDGLAKASIKTMDGLALASVKTWNGLT